MRLWLLLVGIAVLVIGPVGGGLLSFIDSRTYDPLKDPVARVTADGPVELKKGDYEIWEDKDEDGSDIEITDPDGNEVETEWPEMVPIQKGHCCNYLFTAEKSGTYTFEVEEDAELFIVEPKIKTTLFILVAPCCGGLIVGFIGIILIILGIALRKKK